MSEKGVLRGIAIRPGHGVPMQALEAVLISADSGVAGDYAQRRGKRQVTVLTQEAWEAACAEAGAEGLPWTARRANLLVEGVALAERVGDHLQIGEVTLEITGETAPCSNMDDAHFGLRAALEPEWRGGVTCRVLQGGTVRIGTPITIAKEAPP